MNESQQKIAIIAAAVVGAVTLIAGVGTAVHHYRKKKAVKQESVSTPVTETSTNPHMEPTIEDEIDRLEGEIAKSKLGTVSPINGRAASPLDQVNQRGTVGTESQY